MEQQPGQNEQEPKPYNVKEIEDLRSPVEKILETIGPAIERGEYQLIIGDDASGRVPTLIFKRIVDDVYDEHGFGRPITRFIAGAKHPNWAQTSEKEDKEKKVEEYLSSVKKQLQEKEQNGSVKALVVTDSIHTGVSLDPLVNALRKLDIDFDIVTISAPHMGDYAEGIRGRWGKEFIVGQPGESGILKKHLLGGVVKRPRDLFAESIRRTYLDYGAGFETAAETVSENLTKAHEDEGHLASEIYKKWREEHPLVKE